MDVLKLEFINIKNGNLVLEGYVEKNTFDKNLSIIVITSKNNKYNACFSDYYVENSYTSGKKFFKIIIPNINTSNNFSLKIYVHKNNVKYIPNLYFMKYIKLYNEFEYSYFIEGEKCISYDGNELCIQKNSLFIRFSNEFKFLKQLIKKGNYKDLLLRAIVFVIKNINKSKIWLFMDRIDSADDNAEALFKYAIKKNDRIKKYFILSPKSKDFKRIKAIGNVISYNTLKHKLLMILADKMISSHVDVHMREPFRGNGKILNSLSDFQFIFLQHGIIKDDLSDWLNKYNKNIDIFVTSTYMEYKSILEGSYGYEEENIRLTGLARYDYLENKSNTLHKKILIMPTWRNSLISPMNEYGDREYSKEFKSSTYFKIYNNLINDESFLNVCDKYGYEIIFMPHPNMIIQLNDFNIPNRVSISNDRNYNRILTEGNLLITDYSSVAFDFAYMKKPIIYYQFDYEKVFGQNNNHIYKKGYFDYEQMGLGPVCYSQGELIKEVTQILKNDCNMGICYLDRVKEFFRYHDKKNCERIYNEIKKG